GRGCRSRAMTDLVPIVAGAVVAIAPGVRRVPAANPGVIAGPGTNTYILGDDKLALIDPGPALDAHRDTLLAVVGDRLRWIFCTHTHCAHSPVARVLRE